MDQREWNVCSKVTNTTSFNIPDTTGSSNLLDSSCLGWVPTLNSETSV
jgi:hypothetical protein